MSPVGDNRGMNAELSKTFRFEAGHYLTGVPATHKCARPHGHSYRLVVTVAGPVDPTAGWVMDFGDIKVAVEPLVGQLDHAQLNDIPGLANPTSEHIAQWFWLRLRTVLPLLKSIGIQESDSACCTYFGD